MKPGILYFGYIHPNNEQGLNLLKTKLGIEVFRIGGRDCIDNYKGDWIVLSLDSPCPNTYEGKLVICGPHFFPIGVNFPIIFNGLGDWVREMVGKLPNVMALSVYFPLDCELYREDKESNDYVVVYTKHRHPNDINKVLQIAHDYCGNTVKHFDYNIRYNFKTWMDTLRKTRYCIWFGSSESQGFAMQEVLANNIPIILIDCEYWSWIYPQDPSTQIIENIIQEKIPSTSATIWSEKCGVKTTIDNLHEKIIEMELRYMEYLPRTFVKNNLEPSVIYEKYNKYFMEYKI